MRYGSWFVSLLMTLVFLQDPPPPPPTPVPQQPVEIIATVSRGPTGATVEAEVRQIAPGRSAESGGLSPVSAPRVSPEEAAWNNWCAADMGPYVPGARAGAPFAISTSLGAAQVTLADAVASQESVQVGAVWDEAEDLTQRSEAQQLTYYEVICTTAAGTSNLITVARGPGAGAPAVNPLVLRASARARVEPPEPILGTSPPFDERPAIVQLPTWLWLENPWEPIVATESAGGVSVAVIATPQQVQWVMGDGSTVVCDGPGVVWHSGMSEDATDCAHTYRRSTAREPDLRYQGDASVTWDFTWTLNGADQGSFGAIETATDFSIQVGEIQAIASSPNS